MTELPQAGVGAPERADAARNREAILAAARRLVARGGIECLTMDLVAREAGVGKGTLFRRFGDRAGLVRALLEERERGFQDELIRGAPPLGPGAPPRERLLAFGLGWLDLLEEHGELLLAAEVGGGRYDGGPYPLYRAHVALLLREADPGLDADWAADTLLAALGADLFAYLRRGLGMEAERLAAGWTLLVSRLLPA